MHNIFKMEDKDGADEGIIASVQIHPGMYAILKLKSFWYNTWVHVAPSNYYKHQLINLKKGTHSSNIWFTSELKNLHFPSVMPSVPACFNLMMQASTSVGKHWGRLGSAISDELASPVEIPFWSVELSKESLFVTEAFSSVVTALLLPFTMPGSVLTMPWLLCCDEFCTFCGEELFTITLFVPCDPPVVNTMFEETVAEVFFAEEDGEDSMFTMFAFPKLSLFLCFFSFFSFSFSLLKVKSKSLHLYCMLMQVLFTSVLFWWFYVTLVTNWSIGKCLKTSIVETLRKIKNLHVLPRTYRDRAQKKTCSAIWDKKYRNTQNGSKSTNHKSQIMTFWTSWRKLLFPKRFTKMIEGSKKPKPQLAYELQNSHVYEKGSKKYFCWCSNLNNDDIISAYARSENWSGF